MGGLNGKMNKGAARGNDQGQAEKEEEEYGEGQQGRVWGGEKRTARLGEVGWGCKGGTGGRLMGLERIHQTLSGLIYGPGAWCGA